MKKDQACIFLNGSPPKTSVILKVKKQSGLLICADGAANYLKKQRIVPDIILGDLDSIDPAVLKYYRSRTQILKIEDQHTTDFEKALIHCRKEGIKNVLVLGFSSKQADHTLGNFSVMKRFYRAMSLTLLDDSSSVSFVDKKTTFFYKIGEVVSLLAFPIAKGVTTKGLQYPLRGEGLGLGIRDGIRNRATSARVRIELNSGDLLLFKKHFIK